MKAVDPETHYPIVNLHRQMFVWSALLLASCVWMFWADYDREWKKYQREFFDKEHEKAVKADQDARKSIDPEMVRLEGALADAEKALEAKQDEIDELQKTVDEKEVERTRFNQQFLDADQQVKSAKYFWDEAEHEVQQGHGSPDHAKARKDTYQTWIQRMADLKRQTEEAQTAKEAALAKRKAIEKPALDLREKIANLQLQIAKLDKRLKDTDNAYWANRVRRVPFVEMLNPDIKIKQVLIDGLVDDYYFAKVGHVDRCHTCHLAIDRKGYENEKNPLKTHPRLDLYVSADSKHPIEQHGCTGCHSGSGRSCTFTTSSHTPPAFSKDKEEIAARWEKDHHWHVMHHWDDPQLPSDLIASSCWKCHKQETELEGAEPWNEGRKVFDRAGCFACHRTQGFEGTRRPGPSLYHIGDKTTKEWAFQWVMNPSAIRPDTRMPRFFGVNPVKEEGRDRAEALAVVEYVFAASESLGDPAPPIAQDKASVENGKTLVESVGCLACHSLEARAAGTPAFNAGLMTEQQKAKAPGVTYQTTFGPVLAGIGSKSNYSWLWHWVKMPRHHFPETRMPDLRLSDQEAADVAAYLMSLKDEHDFAAPAPETKELHNAAWEYLRAKHTVAEVGERDGKSPESYGTLLAQDFFSAQVTGATAAAEQAVAGKAKGAAMDRLRGRLSLMAAAGVWKEAGARFDSIVTEPLANDLKDDAAMKALEPGLARAKAILTDWSAKLVAADLGGRERLYLGDRMVNRYGCFSCHNLRGFEATTPVGRDFTGQDGIGSKDLVQIDFAFMIKDGEIHHKDRWAWMDLKIKEPRIFDRGYEKKGDERLRMPRFSLTEEERHKLIVFLASLVKTDVPVGMQKRLNEREGALERGRTLVRERNCAACHRFTLDRLKTVTEEKKKTTLEGLFNFVDEEDGSMYFEVWKPNAEFGYDPTKFDEAAKQCIVPVHAEAPETPHELIPGFGGDIVSVQVAAGVSLKDARTLAPPVLNEEGKKVQSEWLFQFLKQPVPLRGFLQIRMPTFGLTDEEATDLVRWFMLRDGEPYPFRYVAPARPMDSPEVQAAKKMFESEALKCISCHIVEGKAGSGGDTKAPDLTLAKTRLKAEWMRTWLKDPGALQPGTKMPKFSWGSVQGFTGSADEQIDGMVEYLRRIEVK